MKLVHRFLTTHRPISFFIGGGWGGGGAKEDRERAVHVGREVGIFWILSVLHFEY